MGIYIFISALVILACILQIMIVLVQNSKGGGLAANFTSAGQSMGVRKTADFLEKSTWTLAGRHPDPLPGCNSINTQRSGCTGISDQGFNRKSTGSERHSYTSDTGPTTGTSD